MSEQQGTAARILAGKSGHDATVVEGAMRRRDAIVTSNHTHIRTITDGVRAKITIGRI